MNEYFYELIRVSIGNQNSLSHQPSQKEWDDLYKIAQKQSLVGICFVGIQKLRQTTNVDTLSQQTYMQWLAFAARIQQRNELLDCKCKIIQEYLINENIKFCILKGQGVARYYNDKLINLRQPGDIDLWFDGDFESILSYLCKKGNIEDINEIHAHWPFGDNVDVEVHFTPSFLSNRIANRRLQKWFHSQKKQQFSNMNDIGIHVPTDDFNQVFLLLHIYRHLFGEGIGLRQIMDLYFAYKQKTDSIENLLISLGLQKFDKALNWVMWHIFENEDPLSKKFSSLNTNEDAGRFVLAEMEQMGNFGKYDERYKLNRKTPHFYRFIQMVVYKMRFAKFFPLEVAWQPIDIIRRFVNYRFMKHKITKIRKDVTYCCRQS